MRGTAHTMCARRSTHLKGMLLGWRGWKQGVYVNDLEKQFITTLPNGGVFIDGHYGTQKQCEQAATANQECVEGTVLRKENYDN